MRTTEPRESPGADPAARDRALAFAAVAVVLFTVASGVYVNDRLRWGFHENEEPPVTLRINVNHADAATLRLLPGVGPSLAERIITARDGDEPFTDAGDLEARVKGIGPKTIDRIHPHITFTLTPTPSGIAGARIEPDVEPARP